MKYLDKKRLLRIVAALSFLAFVFVSSIALADVGNQNRYSSGSDFGDSGSGDIGWIVAFLSLFIHHPVLALILLGVFVVVYFVSKKKGKTIKNPMTSAINQNMNQQYAAAYDNAYASMSNAVAEQIRAIDPNFSADKFTSWVREVFIKLQQAWTERNWKTIRPFESEELFSLHNSQLQEYIRSNKINVIEKIGIKSCSLKSFVVDGDKEVLTVQLSAVMRDYVIDATTRKVLESDPNRDWNMTYDMVFIRKSGVKTHEGLSNKSTTNCPNCGAPTEITSAGQCSYCGSVITTGEHDWVLTDIHSI